MDKKMRVKRVLSNIGAAFFLISGVGFAIEALISNWVYSWLALPLKYSVLEAAVGGAVFSAASALGYLLTAWLWKRKLLRDVNHLGS